MIKRISAIFSQLECESVYQYGFLIAIILLALFLRLYKLGEWSFWIDEIYTVNRAQSHFNFDAIISHWPPSLSVIFTGGALYLLGLSEWSARLVPMLIGVISFPLLYFPIKKAFNPGVAIISLLIIALSPWHLYWSQNARFYTSLFLLYNLSLFAFFFGIEKDRFWYIIIALLLLGAAVGERLIALFLVPVLGCYLVFLKIFDFEMPPGFRIKNLVPILLAGIVFGIYEMFGYFHGGSFLENTFLVFYNNPLQPPRPPLKILYSIFTHIDLSLVCVGLAGGLYLLWNKKRIGLLLFFGALIPVFLIFTLAPFVWTDDRYVFITLSSWVILSAVAVKELFFQVEGIKKILVLGIILLLVAAPAFQDAKYYRGQKGRRPDWRQIYMFINKNKIGGDLVIATHSKLGQYYLSTEVLPIYDMDPDVIITRAQRTWFVVDAYASWISPSIVAWIRANSQLTQVFLGCEDNVRRNVLIYLYEPSESL